jgi:hypothetical protein
VTRPTTRRGGGQAAASAAIPTSDETLGKRRSKIADGSAKKRGKTAAVTALAADAATAASVASPSSAATKIPGKILVIFMFIRFTLYEFV